MQKKEPQKNSKEYFEKSLSHVKEDEIPSINFNEETGNSLYWKEIQSMPVEFTKYGEGIYAELFSESENHRQFIMSTQMESEFKEQSHPDVTEKLKVLSGEMFEKVSQTYLEEGESITIKAGVKHQFITLKKDTISDVKFTRYI